MNTIDKSTIQDLNLKRYLGKWYEIARFNHRFERNLHAVTAEYTQEKPGKIRVKNCGHKGSPTGPETCAIGKAHLSKNSAGQLRVSFFLFFYSDYNILELDTNYEWALIGSSTSRFLWILSRTPQLPSETLNDILGKAKKRGYNTDKLIFPEHYNH